MHKPKPLPPIEFLQRYFDCDPVAGKLIWKRRPLSDFPDLRICNSWNSRFAGKDVGSPTTYGHLTARFKGWNFSVSRVIWKMANGVDPVGLVDHKNGKSGTNALSNLRDIPHRKNTQNRKMQVNNTTGFRGVSLRGKRFVASIADGRRMRHLGVFTTAEAASLVYQAERLKVMGEARPLCETI